MTPKKTTRKASPLKLAKENAELDSAKIARLIKANETHRTRIAELSHELGNEKRWGDYVAQVKRIMGISLDTPVSTVNELLRVYCILAKRSG